MVTVTVTVTVKEEGRGKAFGDFVQVFIHSHAVMQTVLLQNDGFESGTVFGDH